MTVRIHKHQAHDQRTGVLYVEDDQGRVLKVWVFIGPNATIQFAFRTPDALVNTIGAPVIDELQRRTPWTVDDLFLRK
jgi:hypothetical protein